jgi:hypothetical protein
MNTCIKPSKRWFFIVLFLCLTGCLDIIRDYLHDCIAAADKVFPDRDKAPQDEPFKTIEACMNNAGYVYNPEIVRCRDIPYPSNVMDAECYSPKDKYMRVVYVLGDWFR